MPRWYQRYENTSLEKHLRLKRICCNCVNYAKPSQQLFFAVRGYHESAVGTEGDTILYTGFTLPAFVEGMIIRNRSEGATMIQLKFSGRD